MSLKPLRTYFKDRLLEIDKDFKEHTDAFNTDNIGSAGFNKAFHVFYGELSGSSLSHMSTNDVVTVQVTLFMKGFRTPQSSLDDGFDIVNRFRLRSMRPEFAMNGDFIKNVVCDSILAEPVDSNDNSIIFRTSFSVRVIFGTELNLDC